MKTDTVTPPERCPVCGAKIRYVDQENSALYACHGQRADDGSWWVPCPHAMTAALRCGATLEPSPLELARTALVDAAVDECAAYDTAMELRLKPGAERERAQELLERARAYLFMTASNYRSALLESRP